MDSTDTLRLPLRFRPSYMNVVWGGRRLQQWRDDLPDGPIGESWELSDQERGCSVVAEGPLAGRSLPDLMQEYGRELLGATYRGPEFPLLIKIIDAQDKLSVQVHPDDDLAKEMGLGERGKTECWLMLADGGTLYQGTKPGVNKQAFAEALANDQVDQTLNEFAVHDGDFFFLPARTVHALGAGCLLLEVQQSCDITFRVSDWGRMGLDGKPRPLHVDESLRTIDFQSNVHGPVNARPQDHPQGGSVRHLVDCPFFRVEERRAHHTGGAQSGQPAIITNLEGHGQLSTAAGSIAVAPMQTLLVSACAGPWTMQSDGTEPLRFAVAVPY